MLRTLNRMHEVILGGWLTGTVRLDGHDLYGPGVDPVNVRRTVGMVFQQANPFPTMTVYDNVAAGYKLAGIRKSKNDWMASWRTPSNGRTSGTRSTPPGPARCRAVRRATAAAVHRPGDRSAAHRAAHGRTRSALDPISTLAIEDLIGELKASYTIVIVTHNMQRAARISDRTAFFNLAGIGQPGRLVEYDDTRTIFSTPGKRPPRTTSPGASADRFLIADSVRASPVPIIPPRPRPPKG